MAYRSPQIPRLLGVLVALAGLGYVVDNLTWLLPMLPETSIGFVTVVGEFLFPLWLVFFAGRAAQRSRKRRLGDDQASDTAQTALLSKG